MQSRGCYSGCVYSVCASEAHKWPRSFRLHQHSTSPVPRQTVSRTGPREAPNWQPDSPMKEPTELEPSTAAAACTSKTELSAWLGPPFSYTLAGSKELAGGVLDLVELEGGRMLRVWKPPGYSRVAAAAHPYPLLLLNDGQNLFEDCLSFSGCSWRVGETAAQLILSGQLPPFLVAGIDHAGTNRSLDYTPYKPGAGPGGFRQDAAEWPGGGVAAYMSRVLADILPYIQHQYGAATNPSHLAFGGSSLGGICTLWACMNHPGAFGATLVESPSLWLADEKFLREDLRQYKGPWPRRMALAMGGREYSGTRGPAAQRQWDSLLVWYGWELAELLGSQGLDGDRLMWQIDEDAAHNEAAWARRLPDSLAFLLQHWMDDSSGADSTQPGSTGSAAHRH